MDESHETYLYDPNLLSKITFAKSDQKFRPHIPGPMNPGPGLKVRPLSSGDFDRGKNISKFSIKTQRFYICLPKYGVKKV